MGKKLICGLQVLGIFKLYSSVGEIFVFIIPALIVNIAVKQNI